ncbi:SDR family oxidoreductase [Conexibacter stalactiti]|uniref:SDR family oxidoreductase n=1 Tax=Conexibacter stalactiti TaxID=1940611 RepID=A0ABU4HUS8_9ACTN|nr:SDR family oxidoreductase [Conexibacter stalactiti]MDW5597066.1 SDR family oxidoreductase [Conexibacter stalactiti]MEC5037708.1 SDR family oxidoreductase [Conexibacter stalactiti]
MSRWTMPGIDERTVIVTGAASGIGAATASALSEAGSRLLLVDRDADGLERTAAGLDADRVATLAVDLADRDAARQIVDAALAAFGEITTVLHIAGAFMPAYIPDATPEQLEVQLQVNVAAPFWLTRAVLPHLSPGGQIVFCGSTSSFVGSAGGVVYCATKGAVLMLMRAVAVELAPQGFRVNAIAPGTTRTPINDEIFAIPGHLDGVIRSIPDGRIAEAHEHVGAIVYLISDLAAHVHGHTIVIDGGLIAK